MTNLYRKRKKSKSERARRLERAIKGLYREKIPYDLINWVGLEKEYKYLHDIGYKFSDTFYFYWGQIKNRKEER